MCLAVMMNWSQAEIQIKRLNKGVKLTLGTVPGAEEGREREGESVVPGPMLLTEACLY